MKIIGKRVLPLAVLCVLFAAGMLFFLYSYARDASQWATYPVNRHLYVSGRLVRAGSIYDRDGATLALTRDGARQYHKDAEIRRAVMHLVGDRDGNVATSVQAVYRSSLSGWNVVTGVGGDSAMGGDITVTVDAALCRAAWQALDGRRGTVGVMNYRTGEVLCMVSSPTFDPAKPPNVEENPERYEGVYVNRLLSASYPPGSIFKLVTATAAVEMLPAVEERIFICEGFWELDGGRVTCMQEHGEQDLGQALTNSCNAAFAQLAAELGADTLARYAAQAGIGREDMHLDDIHVSGGSFSLDGASEAEVGWTGVGQGKTMVNPLTYLQFVSSIATGGERTQPHIVKSLFGRLMQPLARDGQSMGAETAGLLKEMMRANVVNSYGEGKLEGYRLCAKTGTAEVGGGREPHSWFTGFLDSEQAPLSFIVIVENGGLGSAAAASVAREVLAKAVA